MAGPYKLGGGGGGLKAGGIGREYWPESEHLANTVNAGADSANGSRFLLSDPLLSIVCVCVCTLPPPLAPPIGKTPHCCGSDFMNAIKFHQLPVGRAPRMRMHS